jgi:hypothetical protein
MTYTRTNLADLKKSTSIAAAMLVTVFERCPARISAGRPPILTEVYSGLLQSPRKIPGYFLDYFILAIFQTFSNSSFTNHFTIRPLPSTFSPIHHQIIRRPIA